MSEDCVSASSRRSLYPTGCELFEPLMTIIGAAIVIYSLQVDYHRRAHIVYLEREHLVRRQAI